MKLKIERKWKKETYTIGRLFVDGIFFSNTLEDTDRGLKKTDSLSSILNRKVWGETAIPSGTYQVRIDIVSPKYAAKPWYKNFCGGKMPRIMDIPGYSGVLVHPGNSNLDTWGCVLVGKNTVKGGLTQSRDTFKVLYGKMKDAVSHGETIQLEIV